MTSIAISSRYATPAVWVSLMGITDILRARSERVGFFAPVREASWMDLMGEYFQITTEYGLEHAEFESLHGAMEIIVERFERLKEHCDLILIEGVEDRLGGEFDRELVKVLNAQCLRIIDPQGRNIEQVMSILAREREAMHDHGIEPWAHLIYAQGHSDDPSVIYMPPRAELEWLSLEDLLIPLGAHVVMGNDLHRLIHSTYVVTHHVSAYLRKVEDHALIILSADRLDLICASLLSLITPDSPKITGILLTDGTQIDPHVLSLLAHYPLPILSTPLSAVEVVHRLTTVRPHITSHAKRRIALAVGMFHDAISTKSVWERIQMERSERISPMRFVHSLMDRARRDLKHVVLCEGEEDRIIRASEIVVRRGIARLTLLGDEGVIHHRARMLGVDLSGIEIIDPVRSPWLERFTQTFHTMRAHKGLSQSVAHDAMVHTSYFGTMMVHEGLADAMLSGAVHTTADTIRPALQIIKTQPQIDIVSSVFFMCLESDVLVYGDCAINPNPSAEELAQIALSSARTARDFGLQPKVAMLSYATGESAQGEEVDKVARATHLVRLLDPTLEVEGPIQYDAAIDESVATIKMPHSLVAGHANVLIFPDLNTGNNTYKAVQRSTNALAIGPILQGLKRPINDLSRGCSVEDIITTVAISAIQAQTKVES